MNANYGWSYRFCFIERMNSLMGLLDVLVNRKDNPLRARFSSLKIIGVWFFRFEYKLWCVASDRALSNENTYPSVIVADA